MKVNKAAFDAALAKMIRTQPLPAAEIQKRSGPKRKAKKGR